MSDNCPKRASDCFRAIRRKQVEAAKLKACVSELMSKALIKRAHFASVGHGTPTDRYSVLDTALDKKAELERLRAELRTCTECAESILYGFNGTGGLCAMRDPVDANIVCAHYLRARSWRDIATEYASPTSAAPIAWCKMRAKRALDFIDKQGGPALAHVYMC